MSTTDEEKQFLQNICQNILDSNITWIQDLHKNISKKKIENEFLKELLEEIIDSFEHMPKLIADGPPEPYGFFNIYLIFKLLSYDVDMNYLERAYKDILKIKQLDRGIIDSKLSEFLRIGE